MQVLSKTGENGEKFNFFNSHEDFCHTFKIKDNKLKTAGLPGVEESKAESYNDKYHTYSLPNRVFLNLCFREKEDFNVFNVS